MPDPTPQTIAAEVARLLDAKLDVAERKRSAELYVHLQGFSEKVAGVHEELVKLGINVDTIREGLQGQALRLTDVERRTGGLEAQAAVTDEKLGEHGRGLQHLGDRADRHGKRLTALDGRATTGLHEVEVLRTVVAEADKRQTAGRATRWKMASAACALGMLILALVTALQRCSYSAPVAGHRPDASAASHR